MSSQLTSEQRRKKIWRDVWIWVVLTAVILTLKWGFEHTEFGHDVKLLAHKYILQRLISARGTAPSPITIVDISDLDEECIAYDKATNKADKEIYKATPRDKLWKLIETIAKHNPRAIGVDVDFSLTEKGWVTPGDPDFFESCLDLSTRKDYPVPVVLGIYRTQRDEPKHWLGSLDYKDLAASIFLPQKDTRKLWEWIKPTSHTVPTMSSALAKHISEERPGIPKGLDWAVHQFSQRDLGRGYLVNEYNVDYSALDSMESMRLITIEAAGIEAQGHLLKDKVVLIGNATLGRAMDTFPVPVRREPVTGVYLHASGAYTLAKSPLYELSGKGRLVLDTLLAAIIILAITAIRLRFHADVNVRWLQGALTIVVVIGALVVGVLLVHITHVLWDDFLLVIAGLLLHRPVERWLSGLRQFVNEDVRPILRKRVLQPERETNQ